MRAGWAANLDKGLPAFSLRSWWPALLLLMLGCRTPAARLAVTTPDNSWLPCSVVFARQIVEDSTVEMTRHPLRTGATIVSQSAKGMWHIGHGAYGKRVAMPLAGEPPTITHERQRLDEHAFDSELEGVVGEPALPAKICLYPDGLHALAALEQIIAGANESIDVLMFQWENDTLGAKIAAQLAAKASSRVRVRILVDGGGNLIFGAPRHAHAGDVNGVVTRLAEQPNVEMIRTRNPFGWVDHRKLVVADRQRAWTGGRNFTHKSFFEQRDLTATLEGPIVDALAKDFDEFWEEQGGSGRDVAVSGGFSLATHGEGPTEPGAARSPARQELRVPELATCAAGSREAPAATRVRQVYTRPRQHQIERMLYYVVDHARHHIYIENYTFCDGLLVYKLAQARQRGVDVRVVLTLSDCTAALNHANRVIANRLLAAGVRVFVDPGMTHTKAAAVDGCWAYVGSGNFDPLSLRRNYELGLAITDAALVLDMECRLFEADFRPEWELREPLPLSLRDYFWEVVASFCL